MSALFVAWRGGDAGNGFWGPVGRLEHADGVYRFCYTRGALKVGGFRPFPQMSDLNQVYESETLFPLFANRLLSPSRPEYDAYLRWGGFDPGNPPDPIAILGVTEGIKQTDFVEVFPCPTPDASGSYASKFFLHGIRWMHAGAIERIARLKVTEKLFLMPDPCNPSDRRAVAVRTDAERTLIGYVPRYLAHDAGYLLSHCHPDLIEVHVESVNPDAPLQQRILCGMTTCWPEDFHPCSDDAFQPLASNVHNTCEQV